MSIQPAIDLHYWPTPNGYKVSILLEELGLPYHVIPVNIRTGEQFKPAFLQVSPNNRIPALVDHAPAEGGEPISLFETGAIMLYLAEKAGQFIPSDIAARADVLQWLFWQMGGLGPMSGQAGHFYKYAPDDVPYAKKRYSDEVNRLYGVMDKRLQDRDYLAGEYSIADMACWPWVTLAELYEQDLAQFPNLKAWYERIEKREAVQKGIAVGSELVVNEVTDEMRAVMFGQRAENQLATEAEA